VSSRSEQYVLIKKKMGAYESEQEEKTRVRLDRRIDELSKQDQIKIIERNFYHVFC
jgi:hypothetical protein